MALEAVLFVLGLVLDSSSESPEFSSYREVKRDKKLLFQMAFIYPPKVVFFIWKKQFPRGLLE